MADEMRDLLKIDVKPGQKFCSSCRKDFAKKKSEKNETISALDEPADTTEATDNLNVSLTAVGLSPLKYQRIGATKVHSYAKRKISQAHEVIAKQIAATGNLDHCDLLQPGPSQQCTNCTDYNKLIEELKEKLRLSKRPEWLSGVAPRRWGYQSDW